MRGIIHPGRSSSLREWTRVEAVLKADGRGLRVDPAAVTVTGRATARGAAAVDGLAASASTGWDVPGPPGIIVSVAVEPRQRGGRSGSSGRSSHSREQRARGSSP